MGIISTVGSAVGGWLGLGTKEPAGAAGPDTSGVRYTRRGETEEKVRSGPPNVQYPNFLPFFDQLQSAGETEAMRLAYRRMFADPNVKAAVLGKVLGVAALELSFRPYRKGVAADHRHADFARWCLVDRLQDGVVGLAWSVLSGALVDGHSVSEKVKGVQEGGEWQGKHVLRQLKPKDVNQDLVLLTDQYRNVTGVMGLRYNAGEIFPPSDFLIYSHLPLYGNPGGMSDLRAAYGRYWMLDTVLKLRAMGAEKRALPVIAGEYPDSSKQSALERALAAVKSSNWLAVPAQVKLQVLDIAGSSEDYFKSFCADLKEDILLGIQGATLQLMAGREGQQRGKTDTHKDSADLFKWHLQTMLCHLINNHEGGLVRDLIDPNFPAPEVKGYPKATMGGVDDGELGETVKVDLALQKLGFRHKVRDVADRYGREPAGPDDEALEPPGTGAARGQEDRDDDGPGPGAGKKDAEGFAERPPFGSRAEAARHARALRDAALRRARAAMRLTTV